MIGDVWIENNARRTTQSDMDFYNRATDGLFRSGADGLDGDGRPIPYGSGPHCVQVFRAVKKLTGADRIFEIGFNRGHGSAIWLALGCQVVSTDIVESPELIRGRQVLTNQHCPFFCYMDRHAFCGGDLSGFFPPNGCYLTIGCRNMAPESNLP